MSRSALLLIIDELREMKRGILQLNKEVRSLRSWQGDIDQKIKQLASDAEQDRLTRSAGSLSRNQPDSYNDMRGTLARVRTTVQERLTPILPFLKNYDFSTTPLILQDLR